MYGYRITSYNVCYTKLLRIPVIALTASALDWNKNFVLTHGFEGFLSKPIEEELLNTTINDLLYGK